MLNLNFLCKFNGLQEQLSISISTHRKFAISCWKCEMSRIANKGLVVPLIFF